MTGRPDRIAELTGVLEARVNELFGEARLAALADRIPELASTIDRIERHGAESIRLDFFRPGRD
jgi:hypothetical protein